MATDGRAYTRRVRVGASAAVLFLLALSAGWGSAGAVSSAAVRQKSSAHAETRWRATVARLPTKGKPLVRIGAISCSSRGNCGAVGSYAGEGLLLTEKRGHWTRGVEAVLPADANAYPEVELSSISCPSAGNCTAVGEYTRTDDVYGTLLLSETSGHWAPGLEAVLPANAQYANVVFLNSVSCASAGNCTAVGSYDYRHGVVLTEKAGHWARGVEPPLPSDGDGTAELNSVSCSLHGCSAVGYYNVAIGRDTAAGQGLLLTKKRRKWRAVKAVMPPDGPGEGVVLDSVSCASAGNCGAIGTYNINIDDGYAPDSVLLTQEAGKWRRGVTAIGPKKANVELIGVSCGSPGACVATGSYYRKAVGHLAVLAEDAGTWQRGVEPAVPRHAHYPVGVVSCASAGNCTVVGRYWSNGSTHGFLSTEIAGRWARGIKTPVATTSVDSVSCAAPGECGAVGSDPHGRGILLDSFTRRRRGG